MEKLLKIKETADLLGLAEITIRQWILKGTINSVKVGGSRRIPESEILRLQGK
jgi:excisionase family DNA binding protein